MANREQSSLHPKVISDPNPNPNPTHATSSSSSSYPSVDTSDPDKLNPHNNPNSNPNPNTNPSQVASSDPPVPAPVEETIFTVPGAIIHLIDKQCSVPLGIGDISVVRIQQDDNFAAVLVRLTDEVQWPLMKDVAVVKVDDAHYFFTLPNLGGDDGDELLSYGLSFASKGQEALLNELDGVFAMYGNFSIQAVSEKSKGEVPGIEAPGEMSPDELKDDKGKKEIMASNCGAYWTTLAPNVEGYNHTAAKYIATGSGHLIKGILWCGDVAIDRLVWGHRFLRQQVGPAENMEVDDATFKRIQRVKTMSMLTQKAASGLLTGVLKVSDFFTSSFLNSSVGQKLFSLIPGEVVVATLDGFDKICDAAEVAGKNVLSTTSSVTTELASHSEETEGWDYVKEEWRGCSNLHLFNPPSIQ